MKKVSSFQILMLSAIIYSGSIVAQNRSHSYHSTSQESGINDVVTATDVLNIKGFDEVAALNELNQMGVSKADLMSAMRSKKIEHILKQRGLSMDRTVSFSNRDARVGPCDNAGFGYVNFTNWTGATGFTSSVSWTAGLVNAGNNSIVTNSSSQHTIHDIVGNDPNAINTITGLAEIPVIAPGGGTVSARLGNAATGFGKEKLEYPIYVTSSNSSFTYQYAVVLEDPGHSPSDQPSFNIKVLDPNGVQVAGNCGIYSVNATAAATDTSFKPFNDITFGGLAGYYKKWTTVTIDLIAYIGNPLPCTIVFETRDCNQGGHFGYAYIDATCSQLQASVNFCPNDTLLLLTAPGGFTSYQWYNNAGTPIPGPNGTNDTLVVNNPVLGQTYNVNMFAASGCGSSLTVTLGYSNMNLSGGVITNVLCPGDNDGSAYVTPSGAIAPFNYTWVDSASGSTVSTNDTLLNASAGTYYVTVISWGGCSKTDTLVITEPPSSVDSLEVNMVFCPGDGQITLFAPTGGLSYTWYAGSNSSGSIVGTYDTIVIYNPMQGDQYYLEIHNNPPLCPTFLAVTLYHKPPAILSDYIVKTNVFTPNGDGKNDLFDLSKFDHVQDFSVEIYNRWGKKVFESDQLSKQWDGKINGKAADEGVYYWIAKYKSACLENAPTVENTGFVQILR